MRTSQSLLAERRSCVLELARETDLAARAMLQFAIDQIDRELHGRRPDAIDECFAALRPLMVEHVGGEWSPSQFARRTA